MSGGTWAMVAIVAILLAAAVLIVNDWDRR